LKDGHQLLIYRDKINEALQALSGDPELGHSRDEPADTPSLFGRLALLEGYADNAEFWVDQGIGHRVCAWIEGIRRKEHSISG